MEKSTTRGFPFSLFTFPFPSSQRGLAGALK